MLHCYNFVFFNYVTSTDYSGINNIVTGAAI